MATPPEAIPLASAYLKVMLLSLPASFLLVLMMMALRGVGDSMTPAWFMLLGLVLDAGLNPFFIAGIGPFPKLGIAGSAVATLIANFVGLAGVVIVIYRRDLPIRLRGAEFRYLIPTLALLRLIVSKGVVMAAQMFVFTISALMMIGMVNHSGVITTAAYGVALQIWNYVQMPSMAMGAAVSAMAAQNIGAGRWDRVGQITRLGLIYNLILTTGARRADHDLRSRGAGPVPWRQQRGDADRAAYPVYRRVELHRLGNDAHPVRHGARQRRGGRPADRDVRRPRHRPRRLRLLRPGLAGAGRAVVGLPVRIGRGDGLRLALLSLRPVAARHAGRCRAAGGASRRSGDAVSAEGGRFDWVPHLSGRTIDIRPLVAADREALYAVASDPLIWEVHPIPNRWQRPMFDALFDEALAEGGGVIVSDKATGAMIGSSRYATRWCEPGEVEIGWTFLSRAYWGGDTNRDLKATMLAHAFRWYDRVIFRVGIGNVRSRRAMEKIGGIEIRRWRHPEDAAVVEHVVYAIKKDAFLTSFYQ